MSSRQIIHFPGAQSIPGYPTLDVSEAEISVANIDGLAYWPGIFDWDIPSSNDMFLDRVTDESAPVYGVTNINSRFVTSLKGKKAYSIASLSHAPYKTPFTAGGNFTVGVVCREGVGFGSISNPVTGGAQTWYLLSQSADGVDKGKIRFQLGSVNNGGYSAYTGPTLSSTALTYIVLIVNRSTNTVKLRVNGVEYHSITTSALSSTLLHDELRFGIVNAAGTPLGCYGHYLGCIAFTKALHGQELTALETVLADLAN